MMLGQKLRGGFFVLDRVSALSHIVVENGAKERRGVPGDFEKTDRLAYQVIVARAAPG